MTQYAVFLRGINVGGIKVPMTDLKKALEKLNLTDVKTFLQTGNIICRSSLTKDVLTQRLELLLSDRFSYRAKVITYTYSDLEKIDRACPFKEIPEKHRYVILFSDSKLPEKLAKETHDKSSEKVEQGPGVVFWQVDKGQTLKSIFAKSLTKKEYKAYTTSRNLNTVLKMLAESV